MKKLSLFYALCAMLVVGCTDVDIDPNPQEEPKEVPVFTIDSEGCYTIDVEAKGGNVAVNLTTNMEYSVDIPELAQEWISIADTRAEARTDVLTFVIAENMDFSEREALIKINDPVTQDILFEFVIIQKAKVDDSVVFEADVLSNDEVGPDGGKIIVSVVSNIEYKVAVSSGSQSWLSVADTRADAKTDILTILVAKNDTGNNRTAVVSITDTKGGKLYSFDVKQSSAIDIKFSTDEEYVCMPGTSTSISYAIIGGGANTVVEAWGNGGWKAVVEATNPKHGTIVVTSPKDATAGSIMVLATASNGDMSRKSLYFEEGILTDICEVYEAEWELSTLSVTLQTNLSYTVSIPEEATSWLSIVEGTRAELREDIITFAVAQNLESAPRSAIIKLIGECDDILQQFTISQKYLPADDIILFADPFVKRVCVEAYDSNGDGELSNKEASDVKYIPSNFFGEYAGIVESFDELAYFVGVTAIYSDAFEGCAKMQSITIPESVTSIGSYAFEGCSALTTITIPTAVKSIGDGAFAHCSAITEFKGNFAEDNGRCLIIDKRLVAVVTAALTEYAIPAEVEEIGASLFSNCNTLTALSIHKDVKSIGCNAFRGCTGELVVNCNIPGALSASEGAFYGANFTKITLGNSVTSIGDYAFYGCVKLSNVMLPNSISTIGKSAFYGCTGALVLNCNIANAASSTEGAFYGSEFTSVAIGKDVTAIGDYAFNGCNSLTEVTLGGKIASIGAYAFENCSNIPTITLPATVNTIGVSAFKGCNGELVVECNIPDVANASSSAFYGSSFSKITISNNVTKVGKYAFYDCAGELVVECDIPDASSSSYGAFYGSQFSKVTIGDNVSKIGDYAFCYCDNLSNITLPASVTSIGASAFLACSNLANVYISDITSWCKVDFDGYDANPLYYGANLYVNEALVSHLDIASGVTAIRDYSFYNCKSITSVSLPDSVTKVGKRAFYNCSNIESFSGKFSSADGRCLVVGDCLYTYAMGSDAVEFTIPDGVVRIGEDAFYNCNTISITIPKSVIYIGNNAFCGCSGELLVNCNIPDASSSSDGAFYGSNFTKVTINEGVSIVGRYAFYRCNNIASVTIPASVTSIRDYAFYDSLALKTVYCKAATPPAVGASILSTSVLGGKIYVPADSVEAYKSADGWREYAASIVGYEF